MKPTNSIVEPTRIELLALEELCDEFEAALHRGDSVAINDVLHLAESKTDSNQLFNELLSIEVEFDCVNGRQPNEHEYLRRYPNRDAQVREVFYRIGLLEAPIGNKGEARNDRQRDGEKPVNVAEPNSLSQSDSVIPPVSWNLTDTIRMPTETSAGSVERIAHFKLLERLGSGSFGAVWKAHDEKLDRLVAVKTPRVSGLSAHEAKRFVREAKAAARVRHPNIIGVLDVDSDENTVYIVNEFVDGQTLARRITSGRPSAPDAAILCLKIAEALVCLHSAGIIHRDLKPQNIILDHGNEPHLMDFGLAKRRDVDITQTLEGAILGTPAYMAPEQARGDSGLADERTDIYSLGVTLFQLLTGELPFRGSFEMITHQVINADPPKPRSLNRRVPRDLETICLKCIEKQPDHRYQSADEVADEIRRYLERRPIHAQPVSRLEMFCRWTRRNRSITVLCGVIVLLVVGMLVGSWAAVAKLSQAWHEEHRQFLAAKQARRDADSQRHRAEDAEQAARNEAARARSEAESSKRITAFLESIFEHSDPIGITQGRVRVHGESITATDLLHRASDRIAVELADEPRIQAKLMDIIGNVSRSLGMYDRAKTLFKDAKELRKQLLQHNPNIDLDEDAAVGMFYQGWLNQELGDTARAIELYKASKRLLENSGIVETALMADICFNLGWVYARQRDNVDAAAMFRQALSIRQEVFAKNDRRLAITQLALLQVSDENSLLISPADIIGDVLSNDVAGKLCIAYWQILRAKKQGDFEAAANAYRPIIKVIFDELGNQHPIYALALGDYAGILYDAGDLRSAYDTIRKALEIGRPLAPHHPQLRQALEKLAFETLSAGYYQESLDLYAEANAIRDAMDRCTGCNQINQCLALMGLGKFGEAEQLCRNAIDKFRGNQTGGVVSWGTFLHARILHALDRTPEAKICDSEALRILESMKQISPMPLWRSRAATIYAHNNRLDKAEALFRDALATEHAERVERHPRIADRLHQLGMFLRTRGEQSESLRCLQQAYAIRRDRLPDDDIRIKISQQALSIANVESVLSN